MGFFQRLFRGEVSTKTPDMTEASDASPATANSAFFEIRSREHYGQYARSLNNRFLLTWADNARRGRYFLLERNRIVVEGTMSRPNDGKVANNGTFILNEWGTGTALSGKFWAFDRNGSVIISKRLTANLYNNGLCLEGKFAAVQACNSPGSAYDSQLLVFDLSTKVEVARFVPQSGWADEYYFNEDGTLELGYKKLGRFRYALTGDFLDHEKWEEAVLSNGDFSMTLLMVERLLKENKGKLSPEKAARFVKAIDRVEPEITVNGYPALANKLRGTCLEVLDDPARALRYYRKALELDPKVGVKRHIERLAKLGL